MAMPHQRWIDIVQTQVRVNEMRTKLAHHITDAVKHSWIEAGPLAQKPNLEFPFHQSLLQNPILGASKIDRRHLKALPVEMRHQVNNHPLGASASQIRKHLEKTNFAHERSTAETFCKFRGTTSSDAQHPRGESSA